ncbi:hypothetical protein VVD49_10700 [Uliginosibacterium sp. H3]|uniref:FagA protein n=1 Tax=Uliginosibacterium silvisoli TaxID=3114758 RepID=A0ABU6K3Z9_9RHOO|nr:hypothetical protein [Uliginosibacterium sp. H3]
MRHYFCHLSPVEKWRWMGMRVRLSLFPCEPRLLDQYLTTGRWLHANTDYPLWQMAHTTANLLLTTAADPSLPLYWRSLCLDHIYQPLDQMVRIVKGESQQRQLAELRFKLVRLDITPADDTASGAAD